MKQVANDLLLQVNTSTDYVQTSKGGCCVGEDCSHWARLKTPEYALPPLVCTKCVDRNDDDDPEAPNKCIDMRDLPSVAGIPWLLCTDDVKTIARPPVIAAGESSHSQEVQVLRPNELLYLVLIYLENAMASAVVNGLGSLHPLRFDPDCSDETKDCVSAYFEQYLDKFNVDFNEEDELDELDELSLSDAIQFNDFMELRTNAEIDCSSNTEIDMGAETNLQQPKFRQCLQNLQENIGWQVPAQDTLELKVHADVLRRGFYPTFTEYKEDDRNYLRELSSNKWSNTHYSSNAMRICHFNSETFDSNDPPIVMNPFWAEFFDVANEHDSVSEPSLGCDMDPSSVDMNLFTYNTLCHESDIECAQHPSYKQALDSLLPEICQHIHGKAVRRKHIGQMLHAPLCKQDPATPTTCDRRYGTLLGRKGRVANLRFKQANVDKQMGLWQKNNYAFRGNAELHQEKQEELAIALGLLPTDIAGHCLEFKISDTNILSLDRVYLSSDCSRTPDAAVRRWLQNVENDHWSWQHRLKSDSTDWPQDISTPDTSWKCPLHWLQVYHDDNNAYQARTPSPHRNEARFHHITAQDPQADAQNVYAHPTVFESAIVRNVRAAKFINEALACVGKESECHSTDLLEKSVTALMDQQDAWKVIEYTPKVSERQCTRMLDWPHEQFPQVLF